MRSAATVSNGLDQESAIEFDEHDFGSEFFNAVPASLLPEMDERILRSMLAVGLFAHPPEKSPIDYAAHARVALHEAERGIVAKLVQMRLNRFKPGANFGRSEPRGTISGIGEVD